MIHLATRFVPLVLIYLAFLVFNCELITPLVVAWWNSHESSQGLIILPVSLWLTLRQLNERPVLGLSPSWFWVATFTVASVGVQLGSLMHVQLIQFSFLIVAFVAIPLSLYGVNQADDKTPVESYFPAIYGLIALPVWDFINPVFRLASLKATELFLSLSPITHYIEGFRIELASGVFVVDGGCSGLRYMVSALAIALLYAYLYFSKWRTRLYCVASLLVLALVGNWLRIILIVVIGYLTDMKSPLVNDHATFGWVIFAILLVMWLVAMNRHEPQE